MHNCIGMGRIALGTALLAAASGVYAAGYAVKEQSASALGNALAGASTGAENPSHLFFNPAAAGFLERRQLTATLGWIDPSFEFAGSATTAVGTPVSGRDRVDGGKAALVPALYAVHPLSDTLHAGLAVSAPWGLETDYPADWVGRYHALKSDTTAMPMR